MTRKFVVALVTAVLAATTLLAVQSPASATTPGGIFITGHDPEAHVVLGGNAGGAMNFIRAAVKFVTNNKEWPTMLVVTSRISPPDGHGDSAHGMSLAGFDFDIASAPEAGMLDLGTVDFNAYDVVVIASDHGGTLTQNELDILNTRGADLAAYVNNGGGLIAFGEGNGGAQLTPNGGHFDFLPYSPADVAVDQVASGFATTAFGASMGLTDADVNGGHTHNVFLETGGLDVVDVDGLGRPVTLAAYGIQVCKNGIPTASIDDVTQREGTSATHSLFSFTVSLSVAPCGGEASVEVLTEDGTAEQGSDYSFTHDTVSFAVGERTKIVPVPISADSSYEPDELFRVGFLNPIGLRIADGRGTGTILNDDVRNNSPNCSTARPNTTKLWPPDHTMRDVSVTGATDPDGTPVTITITSVTQDEPVVGTSTGDVGPDAQAGAAANAIRLRAERAGSGDGRVYRLAFTGSDGEGGFCTGSAFVGVAHDQSRKGTAVDSGGSFNSFGG